MPLKAGTSRKTISYNIGELMRSWKASGKMGNSHPKTVAEAKKQAAATAYSKARESAKRSRSRNALAELLRG